MSELLVWQDFQALHWIRRSQNIESVEFGLVMAQQTGQKKSRPLSLQGQLQRDPDNPQLLVKFADHLFEQNDSKAALYTYLSATKRAPDNPHILEKIGKCLADQNLHREASRYFQSAYDLGKATVPLVDALILSLRECDKEDVADNLLQQYENNPKLSHQLNCLCAIKYFDRAEYTKARKFAKRAVQMEPANAAGLGIYETLLRAQKSNGKFGSGQRPRIALHMMKAFHYAIMKPIFDVLKLHYDVILTDDRVWVQKFDPSFVFVADSQAPTMRDALPDAKFVYTRHGLISKNFIYDTARTCDYVCVTSETQRDEFIETGGFSVDQIWLTGYAQMDNLFNSSAPAPNLPLWSGRKMVLFAPTFTDRFSSVPMLLPVWNREFHQSLGDIDLVIKPHPIIRTRRKNWYENLQKLARDYENIHMVENVDEDISPYLRRADVLVSDASSVMFQFLAMDRPVIGINNPDRFGGRWFDPNGIEWRWRDMMEQIDDVMDLPSVLQACLQDPSRKADIRAKYRKTLFGSMTDGQTGRRILACLQNFLDDDKAGNGKE